MFQSKNERVARVPSQAPSDPRPRSGYTTAAWNYCTTSSGSRQLPRHGFVAGRIWAKTAQASRHQLRRPPAWALDVQDLAAAERLGVELVVVKDQESGRCFWASIATIRRRGLSLDRGHGRQIALPLRWWASSPGEALRLGQAEGGAVQLGFEEVGNDR